MKTKMVAALVAPFALLLQPPAEALAQQDSPRASQISPSALLLDTIQADNIALANERGAVLAAEQIIAADPLLMQISRENPQFLGEVSTAIHAPMVRLNARIQAKYRPRFLAALENAYSVDEIEDMRAWFASPLGRSIASGTVQNTSVANAMGEALQGGEVSAEAVMRDARTSATAMTAQLTDADFAELGHIMQTNPGLLDNIAGLATVLLPVRVAMENETMLPDEEREMLDALSELYGRYGLAMAR